MKFVQLKFALVVLTLCSSIGAAPVVDDNDDLQQTIKSLQNAFGNLQVKFLARFKTSGDFSCLMKLRQIQITTHRHAK